MAEHGLMRAGIILAAVAFGTSYGTDGAVWGCEMMLADLESFEDGWHIYAMFLLPGGEQAVRQPWRMRLPPSLSPSIGEAFLDIDVPFVRQLDRVKNMAHAIPLRHAASNSPRLPQA